MRQFLHLFYVCRTIIATTYTGVASGYGFNDHHTAAILMAPIAGAPQDALIREQTVKTPPRNYFVALLACGITTAVATPLSEHFDLANIVMLFLLTVVLVAVRLGRGPAVMASFSSVALFDFFFVPPRFSFTVNDPQYLLTFAVMLVVALIIGQLTADLKRQANDARVKERRTHALYEMARELAGALTMTQVTEISRRFLRDAIDAQSAFLLPDEPANWNSRRTAMTPGRKSLRR